MQQADEPVVVATFTGMDEAAIARGVLEQEGIAAFLGNEHLVTIAWQLSQATGGIRLSVPAKDAARAREILASSSPPLALVPRDDADARSDDAHEQDDGRLSLADSLIERAWKSSLVGFLAIPPVFHLWALWLLRRAYVEGGPHTARGRKLARRTMIVSGCAAIAFIALYARVLLR